LFDAMNSQERARYSRQILFAGIGEEGQQRLLDSSAVLIGCGATGTAVANFLVRAGVGALRIIDRDFVEPSNLQRQTLFDESDALENLPKAVAAERRLRAINSAARVEAVVADLTPKNARDLLAGHPLILDGTDNFETRLLLNDAAIALNVPWVYAAAVASSGVTMTILPGETPCLACVLESPAGESAGNAATGARDVSAAGASTSAVSGSDATCDTAGILNSAVGAIAAIESTEAIKLLIDRRAALHQRLISFDVWTAQYRAIRVARNPNCRACVRREFRYLDGAAQPHITMCGRDSVQIHERARNLDLAALQRALAATASEVRGNAYLLRFRVNSYELTVFPDGRAIIKGTRDASVARSLYARYIGS
jgi:molybdopterin-synthase adenylyltransferase